ncbi:unnamed protein product [Closterium sp. Naga37s-1]|nr:unnamed protein product [Closterium sp. Naga37s-1]
MEKKGGSLEVARMGKGEERRDGYEDAKRRRGGESREEVEGRLRECLRERRLWHLLEDRSPLLASLKAHVKHLWKMGLHAVQPLQDVLLVHEPTLEDLQGEKKGALQLFALLLGAPEVTSLRKDELAEVIVRADAWERVRGEGRGGMRGDSDSRGRVREEISTRGGSIIPGLLLRPQQGGLSGVGDTGKIGDEQIARSNQPTQLNGPPSVSAPSPTPPGGQLGTGPAPSPPPASSREGQLGGVLLPQEVGLSDIGDERIARLNRPADVLLTEFLERRMRWEHTEERELLAAKLEAYIRSLIRTNPNALTVRACWTDSMGGAWVHAQGKHGRRGSIGAEEDVQQEKRDVVRVVALLLGCSVPAKAKKLQLVKAISACALWQAHRRREKGRGAGEKGGGGVMMRGRRQEGREEEREKWRERGREKGRQHGRMQVKWTRQQDVVKQGWELREGR